MYPLGLVSVPFEMKAQRRLVAFLVEIRDVEPRTSALAPHAVSTAGYVSIVTRSELSMRARVPVRSLQTKACNETDSVRQFEVPTDVLGHDPKNYISLALSSSHL